jgi:hypothetical protein
MLDKPRTVLMRIMLDAESPSPIQTLAYRPRVYRIRDELRLARGRYGGPQPWWPPNFSPRHDVRLELLDARLG